MDEVGKNSIATNMELQGKLKSIIFSRDREVTKINKLYTLGLSLTICSPELDDFKIRCCSLESIFEEFNKTQVEIVHLKSLLNETDLSKESELSDVISDKYYFILNAMAKNGIQSKATLDNSTANFPIVKEKKQAHLPKLSLPTFSGSFKEWPTFYDLFTQLVHENESMSNIEKFMYLITSCTNDALRFARNLPVTDANYPIVWNSFVTRYQNKRKLATCYLDEIKNISPVNSKSSKSLRIFIDVLNENVAALKTLGLPVEQWSFILLHSIISKVDQSLRIAFELKHSDYELPTFEQFMAFLSEHCKALESSFSNVTTPEITVSGKLTSARQVSHDNSTKQNILPKKSFVAYAPNKCPCCNEPHSIYKCQQFLDKTPMQRRDWIKSQRFCFNCLRSDHMLNKCPSSINCSTCGGRHNSLIHFDFRTTEKFPDIASTTMVLASSQVKEPFETPSSSLSCVKPIQNSNFVLLGTAIIHVKDRWGVFQPVRALIDCGSQTSIMTERCCQRLRLPRKKHTTPIFGLSETSIVNSNGSISCMIKPCFADEPILETTAIVLSKITQQMPSIPLPDYIQNHFKHLNLADADFHKPGDIDFLLGADLYTQVLDGGRLPFDDGLPTPHSSIFGWILMGPTCCKLNTFQTSNVQSLFASVDHSLDDQLKTFWELEDVPTCSKKDPDNLKCETHYIDTVRRDDVGKYIVSYPFKDNEPALGCSKTKAINCFKTIERKLVNNDKLRKDYCQFMQDYIDLNHMKLVPDEEVDTIKYYIPHHPVLKETSSTTKLRVVFNASSRTSNGKSLNDTMFVGPKLQKNIVEVIIKFRMHLIAFCADIKMMYRCISVSEEQQSYQAIVWRDSPTEPLKTYKLLTVTYGLSSSPFLAIRTLQQLALDDGHKYPLAAQALMNDTYVDDIVTGCHSLESAQNLKDELIELLKGGGFLLRKWSSNDPDLLKDIPMEHREVPLRFSEDSKESIKVLGMQWQASQDVFTFHVGMETFSYQSTVTKRNVLSCICKIFDPLGFICPVVFWAKHFIQQLWTLGLGWDEPLPSQLNDIWITFTNQLPHLEHVSIPRYLPHQFSEDSCELHGFCDGSQNGYSAVVYMRTVTEDSTVHSNLLLAKARVAPVKVISIPKLELCGAHLLSKLMDFLTNHCCSQFDNINVFAWTDSTTVLSWIKMSPHRLKTFVANRVTEIQQRIAPSSWHHVPSFDNPADSPSRGIFPQQIIDHPLWWHGPLWLVQDKEKWPGQAPSSITQTNLPEVKPNPLQNEDNPIALLTTTENPSSTIFIERFSSLVRLQRIGAWILRFINNCQSSTCGRKTGPLSTEELDNSLMHFVKQTQSKYFKEEIHQLQTEKTCSPRVRKLDPFVDLKGILRVGGRLRNSKLDFKIKHPILLPKKCHLTNLVIDHNHVTHLHAGPQTTQAAVQRTFWILSARSVIRHRINKCIKCFKFRKSLPQPFMSDLPAVRLQQTRVFLNCAVDFAGPYTTKSDKLRKPQLLKSYLCLFICLSTKAVHLEVVSGLSVDQFLAAFHRFIARRGLCVNIYSDRGTNFMGAKNQIDDYHKMLSSEPTSSKIVDSMANKGINWHFNPPASPHFGGIWEANIKSAKSHIKKVIGEQILTFEELTTLFTQIEAVLNSRPLCALSSDPNDMSALTPGHFIIGDTLTALVQPNLTPLHVNRLSRWQMIQQATQHFWSRWSQEYIHSLQQRQKWNVKTPESIKVGDLVLVKDVNLPPLQWTLARILSLHPGKDGVTRVVTLRTANGSTYIRPMIKIHPLPNQ